MCRFQSIWLLTFVNLLWSVSYLSINYSGRSLSARFGEEEVDRTRYANKSFILLHWINLFSESFLATRATDAWLRRRLIYWGQSKRFIDLLRGVINLFFTNTYVEKPSISQHPKCYIQVEYCYFALSEMKFFCDHQMWLLKYLCEVCGECIWSWWTCWSDNTQAKSH